MVIRRFSYDLKFFYFIITTSSGVWTNDMEIFLSNPKSLVESFQSLDKNNKIEISVSTLILVLNSGMYLI